MTRLGLGEMRGENVHSYWSAAASAAVAVEEIEAGPTIITVRRSRPSESRRLGASAPSRRSVQRLQLASKGLANGNYNRESVFIFRVCEESGGEKRLINAADTHTRSATVRASSTTKKQQQQQQHSTTSFHPVVTTASPTSIAPSTPLHRRTTAAAHILLALVPSALSHRQN